LPGRIRFDFLAEHYLKADFGADSVRPKSDNTTSHVEHVVRAYLVPRFGKEIAEDIKPLDIQRWLKSLHENNGLAWTTVSKMRGVMSRIYKVGILHERAKKNPVLYVETRSKTDYKAIVITPAQTLAILKVLPSLLHFTLVLTCAATALRASEILALRWRDLLWNEGRIRISNAGRKARMVRPKRRRRTDMFRCIRFWPPICAYGENKAPTRRTGTSCSLP
jgi:integrase